MRAFIYNKKGTIYVGIIFIALIIVAISISLMHLLVNSGIIIKSNNDNYRAAYIVESILELKIAEIRELCDRATNNYLTDLQEYKMKYIENANKNPPALYNPPDFYDYIKGIIPNIKDLSESANNFFGEYEEEHSYKVDIECDEEGVYINIISKGEYRRARKFINVKLKLPLLMDDGIDEYDIPKVTILPVNIVQYYQTFGQ